MMNNIQLLEKDLEILDLQMRNQELEYEILESVLKSVKDLGITDTHKHMFDEESIQWITEVSEEGIGSALKKGWDFIVKLLKTIGKAIMKVLRFGKVTEKKEKDVAEKVKKAEEEDRRDELEHIAELANSRFENLLMKVSKELGTTQLSMYPLVSVSTEGWLYINRVQSVAPTVGGGIFAKQVSDIIENSELFVMLGTGIDRARVTTGVTHILSVWEKLYSDARNIEEFKEWFALDPSKRTELSQWLMSSNSTTTIVKINKSLNAATDLVNKIPNFIEDIKKLENSNSDLMNKIDKDIQDKLLRLSKLLQGSIKILTNMKIFEEEFVNILDQIKVK